MKQIIPLLFLLSLFICCKKEKLPFIPRYYEFSKNVFPETVELYGSKGLISSNVPFDKSYFHTDLNNCLFMRGIEINSESLATFHYGEKDDSTLLIYYSQDGINITFERINKNDPINPIIHFIDNGNTIEAPCTGMKFIPRHSLSTFFFFGEISTQSLQAAINDLGINDTIHVLRFNIVYFNTLTSSK